VPGSTLGTLSEHLAGGAPQDLVAQLPDELATYLRRPGESVGESFSAEEFFRRISDRKGASEEAAPDHVRAVMETMKEMVSTGELVDLQEQLPRELAVMLGNNTV
jgi:uncharacterized protein (DUF2267 family)